MKVFHKQDDIKSYLHATRTNKDVGFVPTMGALHAGHASLVACAKKENDIVLASIFVNPTQFNNTNDLIHYPRTLENDLKLLEEYGCDIVFCPDVHEMYPEGDPTNTFKIDLKGIDLVMEGKYRPGHFDGVVLIINKFFSFLTPTNAYFGEKDFQQLQIVRYLAAQFFPNIKIHGCPIKRETDGLAMSSRNMRLNPLQRKGAPFIFHILNEAKKLKSTSTPEAVVSFVVDSFKINTDFVLEYFDIVDSNSLKPISDWKETTSPIACVAAFLGDVRLIDNLSFN